MTFVLLWALAGVVVVVLLIGFGHTPRIKGSTGRLHPEVRDALARPVRCAAWRRSDDHDGMGTTVTAWCELPAGHTGMHRGPAVPDGSDRKLATWSWRDG